jgi:RNA polymerase sigma-70 factor, ECF subfamily
LRDDITQLLIRWRGGDGQAGEDLFRDVYDELHRIAVRHMSRERDDHTLQPTALVSELFLHLNSGQVDWKDRAHFLAAAARHARFILVDHSRKRSSKVLKVQVDEGIELPSLSDRDVVAVDDGLNELQKEDARAAMVIEMRFFGGMKDDEIAEALQISRSTVKRDWVFGRAWLLDYLRRGSASPLE